MTFYFVRRQSFRQILIHGVLFLLCSIFLFGNGTNYCQGRNIALIIGVSDYDDRGGVSMLDYVKNDAVEIHRVLTNAGFKVYSLCEKSTGLRSAKSPTKQNVEETLEKVLSSDNCCADDVVLVYFSGHGKRGDKDKERTLLFVKDSINGRDETCLSAQEIRIMLRDCPSNNTLLLIDSCHAGGTRSAVGNMKSFVEGGVENVVTIASCTVDQVSKKWSDKSMSFFTYWLAQGLKGYADVNEDNTISTDELFEYIRDNLEQTERVAPHGQWPVIVGSKNMEHFAVAEPKPRDLFVTLDDFAEQVLTKLHLQKINTLQFCDFKPNAKVKSKTTREDNSLKSITDYSSRELKRRLRLKSQNLGITVVTEPVQSGAVLENFVLNESTSGDENVFTFETVIKTPDNPASESSIKAKVLAEKTGETINSQTQSEDTVSESGGYQNGGQTASQPASIVADDAEFPAPEFGIEVQTAEGVFVPRPIENIDGSPWVALNPGEVYRVVVDMKAVKVNGIGVRLLVDGRNTLPQYMPYVASKFVIREAIVKPDESTAKPDELPQNTDSTRNENNVGDANTSDEEKPTSSRRTPSKPVVAEPTEVAEVGPHVRLDQARFWILEAPGRYQFNGFYHDIETNSAYDEFSVVSTAEHLTPGQYNEQIGLVTIAFYDLFRTRSPGTDTMTVPGKTRPFPVFVMDGLEIGGQLGCFQLRYASSQSIEAYKRELAGGSGDTSEIVTR